VIEWMKANGDFVIRCLKFVSRYLEVVVMRWLVRYLRVEVSKFDMQNIDRVR
jgi:hypothetical protein